MSRAIDILLLVIGGVFVLLLVVEMVQCAAAERRVHRVWQLENAGILTTWDQGVGYSRQLREQQRRDVYAAKRGGWHAWRVLP